MHADHGGTSHGKTVLQVSKQWKSVPKEMNGTSNAAPMLMIVIILMFRAVVVGVT